MVRVLVDGDACPVRAEVVAVARRLGVEVVLVAGPSQVLEEEPGVRLVRVDSDPQAADLALVNLAHPGDVVVTSDFGLAALALARSARVLSFRGRLVHGGNIEALLESRHAAARVRRGGGRTRGPRAFEPADRERFREALEGLLSRPDSSGAAPG